MNTNYPKFQYSIFLEDREEQIVIRCDTFKELLEAKAEINQILKKRAVQNAFTQPPVTSPNALEGQERQELGNCTRCGSPNKLSKAGKPYCSKVCWK